MNTSIKQFVTFCFVGVSNGIVDFAVYFLVTRFLFPFPFFILPAKAFSYLSATVWSFFINRRVTFNAQHKWTLKEFGTFMSTVGLGIFINVGVEYIVVYQLGWYDLIGVVIAALGTAVWGFIFSKYVVFKARN